MIDPKTVMYKEGRRQALALQKAAPTMTGTEIIAEESKIPAWDGLRDYSGWKSGYPVTDEGQVWTLIQPYNAAHYAGRPSTLRALWGLVHTTNPEKAKPWVDPLGTSGMYMEGECYKDADGKVWRSKQNNNVYPADAWPDGWEAVE